MSRLTNFAENALADFMRGVAMTLPTAWSVRLASAASDTGFTELTGTGYAPQDVTRSLTDWKSTQGNNLASTGTSHATSNSAEIDFGAGGAGGWGTWSHVVLCDDSDNPWFFLELPSPIVINESTPVSIAAGELAWTLGLTGGLSDYLANKLIDLLFRAQAYTYPATSYHGLLTSAPNNAGGGSEVVTGSYSRVALANDTDEWSATDAPGDTGASTGTSGESSNNAAMVYPVPTASWGTIGWTTERDAGAGGNLLWWAALTTSITVSAGVAAPRFAAGDRIRKFA